MQERITRKMIIPVWLRSKGTFPPTFSIISRVSTTFGTYCIYVTSSCVFVTQPTMPYVTNMSYKTAGNQKNSFVVLTLNDWLHWLLLSNSYK